MEFFIIGTIIFSLFRKTESGISGYRSGRRVFGGNSGYSGYSMSMRAIEARNEGKYPKTDFKRIYELTPKVFNLLEACDVIGSYEWHHTSSWGNETPFYQWIDNVNIYGSGEIEGKRTFEIYKQNEEELSKLARDKRLEMVNRYTYRGFVKSLEVPEDIKNRVAEIFEETI